MLVGIIAAESPGAFADETRISAMGNCSIALIDSDNQLNPYDYGRNPAYLVSDFADSWIRMLVSVSERSGELRRPYDPELVNDSYVGFQGRKRLSDRQAASGYFRYERLWQREQWHSLEIDQYNDPFFLTDLTTGDIKHWGPTMSADYSFRLSPRAAVGLGFDYTISSGLKDFYTRPEIVHNFARGNLGLIVQPQSEWIFGLVVRPMRTQNRTNFDKADEGYDNIIRRYSGDGIYEIRSFSSYTLNEIMTGIEVGIQNFIGTDRIRVGTMFSYDYAQNSIRYNLTNPEEVGYWQDSATEFRFLARYTPAGTPLVLGLTGGAMNQDGWAKRPRFDTVLLYDNPIKLRSAGAGASYFFRPARVTVSADYILNAFDIAANDYGANLFQHRRFTQNIGRLGLEYSAYNVYAIRGGVEVTDYLVDRWLKLPDNIDRYRFTVGGSYTWHFWQIDAELLYARSTRENDDRERRDLSGILWFTRSEL
jgi:hypothetical protein